MARLNYRLSANAPVNGNHQVWIMILANWQGTPQGRIYLDGSTAPAFSNLTFSSSTNQWTLKAQNLPVTAGSYVCEYKDDNGIKPLGKIVLRHDLTDTCYPFSNINGETFTTNIWVYDDRVEVDHFLSVSGVPLASTEFDRVASIDGGTNYKTFSTDFSSNKSWLKFIWTNAEIATLGLTTTSPSIRFKRVLDNCTDTEATVVKFHNPLTINHTQVNVSKNGFNNGSIDVTIVGGSGTYTYKWSDGPATQDRSGLVAGSYTVTVTDTSDNVVSSKTVVITQPPALVASYTKTDVTVYAGSDGSITVSVSGGAGVKTFIWNDGVTTQNRSGIPAGVYSVVVKDLTTLEQVFLNNIIVSQPVPPDLNVSYTKVDCSEFGLSDGSIDVSVSGGTAPYTYLWNDSVITQDRSGIPSGNYTIFIIDSTGGTPKTAELQIYISQPSAPLPADEFPENFFQFSILNSLMFIITGAVDNQYIHQTPDNTLFCDQYFPGFECVNYFQKVVKTDLIKIQFNSNFNNHQVVLRNYSTSEIVKGFSVEMKEKLLDLSQDYDISIRNHIDNPGKSRVYFSAGDVPIPLEVLDHFEILNNVDGFNGIYAIASIEFDDTLNVSYLVINKNYGVLTPTSSATGRFSQSTESFNVYESVIDLSDVASGEYYLEASAIGDVTTITATSEPIDLQVAHPNTVLIEYRNIDNAYDISWTTGYVGRIRVEALLGHKRLPGGERLISRNSDYGMVKVNAKKTRGFLFETFMLPPWLHEKLSVIFDTDYWKINGVQYQAAEGYADPSYIYRFKLANSSIKIEQAKWFNKYNSTDLGTINDEGFIASDDESLIRSE